MSLHAARAVLVPALWAVAAALLGGGLVGCGGATAQAPPTPIRGGLKLDFVPDVADTRSLARLPATQTILIGTVVGEDPAQAATSVAGDQVIYTDYRVRVDRPLRDATAGQTIIVRGLGGSGPMGSYLVDAGVRLAVGEQVLLYLTAGHSLLPNAPGEVYSVVGEGHGVYTVRGDEVQSTLRPGQRKPLDQVIREIG
jgi:hypothetical protein